MKQSLIKKVSSIMKRWELLSELFGDRTKKLAAIGRVALVWLGPDKAIWPTLLA